MRAWYKVTWNNQPPKNESPHENNLSWSDFSLVYGILADCKSLQHMHHKRKTTSKYSIPEYVSFDFQQSFLEKILIYVRCFVLFFISFSVNENANFSHCCFSSYYAFLESLGKFWFLLHKVYDKKFVSNISYFFFEADVGSIHLLSHLLSCI